MCNDDDKGLKFSRSEREDHDNGRADPRKLRFKASAAGSFVSARAAAESHSPMGRGEFAVNRGLPICAGRRYSGGAVDGSMAMGWGVKTLIMGVLVGGIAFPAFSQNLYVPAPSPPLPAEPAPLAGLETAAPGQPLVPVPLPRSRPKAYPVVEAAAAVPAPVNGAVAEPSTTGRGQPASAPPSTGQQVRVVNNTAVAVATMALIPQRGPAGPHAFVDNLAPFTATSAPLPAGRGCVFAVHGAFADGSPLTVDHLDLCRDPLINITVW